MPQCNGLPHFIAVVDRERSQDRPLTARVIARAASGWFCVASGESHTSQAQSGWSPASKMGSTSAIAGAMAAGRSAAGFRTIVRSQQKLSLFRRICRCNASWMSRAHDRKFLWAMGRWPDGVYTDDVVGTETKHKSRQGQLRSVVAAGPPVGEMFKHIVMMGL